MVKGIEELRLQEETRQGVAWLARARSPQMFDRISGRYDFLNHLLSLRQDVRWRRKAVSQLKNTPRQTILDLATGTGDLLVSAMEVRPEISVGLGIDPAKKMLQTARDKLHEKDFSGRVYLLRGDGGGLPLASGSVDAALIAFGIRNFADYRAGLRELFRVLKPGGRAVILEFSLPENRMVRWVYLFYFRYFLPELGGWISGDQHAYRYLNRTVEAFDSREIFCRQLQKVGFHSIRMLPLTFGIVTLYIGDKE